MSNLKDNISGTLNTLLDTVPVVAKGVEVAAVAINSWLLECVNHDADVESYNTFKGTLMGGNKKEDKEEDA